MCPFCLRPWHDSCVNALAGRPETKSLLNTFADCERELLQSLRMNRVPTSSEHDWWRMLFGSAGAAETAARDSSSAAGSNQSNATPGSGADGASFVPVP